MIYTVQCFPHFYMYAACVAKSLWFYMQTGEECKRNSLICMELFRAQELLLLRQKWCSGSLLNNKIANNTLGLHFLPFPIQKALELLLVAYLVGEPRPLTVFHRGYAISTNWSSFVCYLI